VLLKDHIHDLQYVTIDRECPGHEHLIRDHILNLFRRRGVRVEPDRIPVGEVKPGSPADKLAWRVANGLVEPDLEVRLADILAEF
jgi:hypothetical protein